MCDFKLYCQDNILHDHQYLLFAIVADQIQCTCNIINKYTHVCKYKCIFAYIRVYRISSILLFVKNGLRNIIIHLLSGI